MTAGRMAIIIMTDLYRAGFLNTNEVGPPSDVIQKSLEYRVKFGDVLFLPDDDEILTKLLKGE